MIKTKIDNDYKKSKYKMVLAIFIMACQMTSYVYAQEAKLNFKDSTLVMAGIYKGKIIHVMQQPSVTQKIKVNGMGMNIDSVFKNSIFDIDLAPYHFKIGDSIKIEIRYKISGEAPVIINPYAFKEYPLLHSKLPPLIAKDINEKEINTNTMIGKVIVINTWFVGCKPCAAEMPALNNVVKKFENQEVVFIAPCLTEAAKVKEFLLKHTFNYDIIPSSRDYCGKMLKCSVYPNNIVVNKKGEIIFFSESASEEIEAILTSTIEKALKENK